MRTRIALRMLPALLAASIMTRLQAALHPPISERERGDVPTLLSGGRLSHGWRTGNLVGK